MKWKVEHTLYACFVGYVVQAVVINFVPLLFLTFQTSYGIPLSQITLLVTFSFIVQLLTDLLSIPLIEKIGYRKAAVFAHLFAGLGLLLVAFLPEIFSVPFVRIIIGVTIYAIGGGLLEVLVSPIVEASPTKNKEKAMSLLHSFYCWGQVSVVLISTIFFEIFGIAHWRILICIWAILPLGNAYVFLKVPIHSIISEHEERLSVKELVSKRVFWLMILFMMCAGASEQAISQWASLFAEKGLHVSKTVGDLAGPMVFAICMGIARAWYGKFGEKINLEHFMAYSTVLCIGAYIILSFVRIPVIGFLGCGICGLSVGILWPGTFSLAAAKIRRGGTVMYGVLALAGDLGCTLGPTIVGIVSNANDSNLQIGILGAIIFPILLLFGIIVFKFMTIKNESLRYK